MTRPWLSWWTLIVALPPTAIALAAFIGLGFHREAAPMAISASATLLVLGPPLALGGMTPRARRPWVTTGAMAAWSIALFALLPVYFPGERRDAVATGLALMGFGADVDGQARWLADHLPDETTLSRPNLAEASALLTEALPPAPPIGDHEIALPFEGAGRRMAVPVVFEHGGATVEAQMTFDTGATYTTLPTALLAQLGASPGPDAPVMRLQTANGEREAQLVLLDRVWLGDLELRGLAVAVCDPCAAGETEGLLGLNVSGAFNMQIDADRQEVIFRARTRFDRHLDVQPFLSIDAWTRQLPGGRVEVGVDAHNRADRPIDHAVVAVRCGDEAWGVTLPALPAAGDGVARERLPAHPPCDRYEIRLDQARW